MEKSLMPRQGLSSLCSLPRVHKAVGLLQVFGKHKQISSKAFGY